MIIYEPNGDIFESRADAIVNPVNCVGVAGKGLAKDFKEKYPGNYSAYLKHCQMGRMAQTRCHLYSVPQIEHEPVAPPYWIVNFPTKNHWSEKSNLEKIAAALDDLGGKIRLRGIRSIAIPMIGCGEGGLDWADVREVILDKLGGLDDVEITLYGPGS